MTQQFRLSLPDEVYAGMERYNALNRSTLFTLALNTIMPLDLKPAERDARLMAALQGRLKLVIVSESEHAAEVAAKKSERPIDRVSEEMREKIRAAQQKEDDRRAAETAATAKRIAESKAQDVVSADKPGELQSLPPAPGAAAMAHPFGFDRQIPLGGNAPEGMK